MVSSTGWPEPMLHAALGLLVYLIVLALGRSATMALGAILAIQLVNEINDYVIKGQQVTTFLLGALGDTIVTVAIPTIITVVLIGARQNLKPRLTPDSNR